ncbi:hypothetical protein [Mesorhizobium amorphae]|uniref:Uncharacterized protein n=1 Tax=Mesorhizobium amorphae CCNWGS0123 TaxID=1082933 RepID=G6Y7L7_9HYPH|nr:hypothetical protein [Mesorhizobium amorphae]ANT51071.1 hypothetical protein A6B35_14665 [Mesorhizobium amorphae CCNWGS0123]EHH12339.1 hypothetical protein MEA186_09665 [Mesorhizobium amorphae CCNWGS0123]GLR42748.1 hypothetical protein GCM10007880_32640 [Mesorhizobium amorphae]
MSGSAFQDKAGAFAAGLMVQVAWPLLLIAACMLATPVIGLAAGPQATPLSAAAWFVAAVGALATLAFSMLILFDALLFRLMASHDNEAAGGATIDDVLARMRLKPAPAATRSLDQRMAGTRRLLMKQRLAFALFAAVSLVAAFL